MQQYFLHNQSNGDTYRFDAEQTHHIKKVLRMKEGSIVKIVDASYNPFLASIYEENGVLFAKVVEALQKEDKPLEVQLVQGLIKKDKWDFMIQKCCELGVDTIIPMQSSRSIVKVEKDDHKKLQRYNKIALESCEQSKRDTLAQVLPTIAFKEIKNYKKQLNIIAYEDHHVSSKPLKEVLLAHPHIQSICIVIGSEGGFATHEVEQLIQEGFICVSLGKRILRAETAAMSVVNICNYHYE